MVACYVLSQSDVHVGVASDIGDEWNDHRKWKITFKIGQVLLSSIAIRSCNKELTSALAVKMFQKVQQIQKK